MNIINQLIEELEEDKIECPKCKGTGEYDYEYWSGLYKTVECVTKVYGPKAGQLKKLLQLVLK